MGPGSSPRRWRSGHGGSKGEENGGWRGISKHRGARPPPAAAAAGEGGGRVFGTTESWGWAQVGSAGRGCVWAPRVKEAPRVTA